MSNPTIFLSHIHEEADLAIMIKNALEAEFSGFVRVFVSSDGTSITPGEAFFDKIEHALKECCASIFLISPQAIDRAWINFELGAMWMRRLKDPQGADAAKIPIIPICHSGMTKSGLRRPLGDLQAINAGEESDLCSAFLRIQEVAKGNGHLSTNFGSLSGRVREFEQCYTEGKKLSTFFKLSEIPIKEIIKLFDEKTQIEWVTMDDLKVRNEVAAEVEVLAKEFPQEMELEFTGTGTYASGIFRTGSFKIRRGLTIRNRGLLESE